MPSTLQNGQCQEELRKPETFFQALKEERCVTTRCGVGFQSRPGMGEGWNAKDAPGMMAKFKHGLKVDNSIDLASMFRNLTSMCGYEKECPSSQEISV